ncbi:hypothetical protein KSP39_PZI004609 [Platanthera zijinensis]|uniref:Integrase catalytic domain-containing protein n=1 Tax=Platanthera zijinensis TaxID=2320716 RepID=A0AAP0BYW0_9ASPA
MTGNPQCFSLLEQHDRLPPVLIADGSPSPVHGSGVVHVTPSLRLEDTLYVPKFPCNLLSVTFLCKQLQCSVTFTPSSCSFQDPSSQRTIATGTESGGLYFLDNVSALSVFSSSCTDLLQWHLRLGHPPPRLLHQLLPHLPPSNTPLNCEACQLGKHHRSSFPPKQGRGSTRPFDLVHSDIWGPAPTLTVGRGSSYFVTFIDDFSRCTWVYLLRERSELFNFGVGIKTFRSDNAKEYLSHVFTSFCVQHGVIHQTSCVYTSQQNGVAERKNRHLLDVARTLMAQMHVPRSYWGYAVLLACYLINRIPSSVLNGKTPFSILYPDKEPFPLPLRIFGCTAFVHAPSATRDKLSPRSTKCVFLGYSATQKGYCCFDPVLRKQFVSADVTFFENASYFSDDSSSLPPTSDSPVIPFVPSSPTAISAPPSSPPTPLPPPLSPPPSPSSPLPSLSPPGLALSATDAPDTEEPADLDLPVALRKGVRTCTLHPLAAVVSYDRLTSSRRAFALAISATTTPRSYQEALAIPHWKMAMDEEMTTLTERGTWTLVPPPFDTDVVGCRWVFVVKFGPDGTVDRYKARLVAKGFTQTYGVDYFDTFSPVARLSTIRVLLSVAVNKDWPLSQLNIKNAFLYGDLQEAVYMEQPPGYVAQGETRVCRLQKAIYGLKQSPRAWFEKFSGIVTAVGFARSSADHSLFIRKTSLGLVVLAVYVDDILLTGDDQEGVALTKRHLRQHLVTKDMGSPKYFLGIEISRKPNSLVISQRKYALDILKEAGLTGAKPARCPMAVGEDKTWTDDSPLLSDVSRYRRLVGKLIYLTVTRPDIFYAVGKVSQFMQAPRECHLQSALRILEYVKAAPGKGLLFQKNDHLRVEAYSDASYADDKGDHKSTSGFCTFVGGNLVLDEYQKAFGDSWKKMQTDIAQPWPYLDNALTQFQDPAEADKLLKIQRDLDETKIILEVWGSSPDLNNLPHGETPWRRAGWGVRAATLINPHGGLQGGPLVDSSVAGRWTLGPASTTLKPLSHHSGVDYMQAHNNLVSEASFLGSTQPLSSRFHQAGTSGPLLVHSLNNRNGFCFSDTCTASNPQLTAPSTPTSLESALLFRRFITNDSPDGDISSRHLQSRPATAHRSHQPQPLADLHLTTSPSATLLHLRTRPSSAANFLGQQTFRLRLFITWIN